MFTKRQSFLERVDCPGQFSCGGLDSQCIPNVLACDLTVDCSNGMDEDRYICGEFEIIYSKHMYMYNERSTV